MHARALATPFCFSSPAGGRGQPEERHIDAERRKLQLEDAAEAFGVMLTLHKSEPEMYTDTFIAALVAVSLARTRHNPCFHSQALPPLIRY
jgi:hypothetical protein